MCGGEFCVMVKKEWGSFCELFYFIKINVFFYGEIEVLFIVIKIDFLVVVFIMWCWLCFGRKMVVKIYRIVRIC